MTLRTLARRFAAPLAVAAALAAPAAAGATVTVTPGTFSVTSTSTQAGGHPDVTTSFQLTRPIAGEEVKDIAVDLPAGLLGDPTATPRCTGAQFVSGGCPSDTVVGQFKLAGGGSFTSKVWNMVPSGGATAEFRISVLGIGSAINIVVRDEGDFGLRAEIRNVAEIIGLKKSDLTLWGVPGDPSHDAQRGGAFTGTVKPFMANPPACGTVTSTIRVRSYYDLTWTPPVESAPMTITGCDQLSFDPSVTVTPSTTRAGTPAGVDVDIDVPQHVGVGQLMTPHVKDVAVTLPDGMTISPGLADGLAACADDAFAAGSHDPVACPDASKVGTVRIDSPVLPDAMVGDVHLGAPQPGNPYRLFLDASADGVRVKLEGRITADPSTGRLTNSFEGNPQVPFSRLRLSLRSGPRAVLTTPLACGAAKTEYTIGSWAGTSKSGSSSFDVSWDGQGAACPSPLPFAPTMDAGTVDPLAGAFSPVNVTVTRGDRDQPLSGIEVALPDGVLGYVGSVPQCAEAAAAAGTCAEASRVGSTTILSGAGDHPFAVSGRIYFAGPYKGAPFSLSIVVPVIAGPYDLGTVVVRAPISVDAAHAKLDVPADPLPQILQGIPLNVRSVNLRLDRPGFTINPTNCTATRSTGTVTSAGGTAVAVATPFQVGGCEALPFHPSMRFEATGRVTQKEGAGLKVSLRQGVEEAHSRIISVLLPKQISTRLSTVAGACPADVAAAGLKDCPESSVVGAASAVTPVLPEPLAGPVRLVAVAAGLPKLVLALQGSGVTLNLDGAIQLTTDGRIRTVFEAVPDVPLADFVLDLPAGPHSALTGPETGLCGVQTSADVTAFAHSGARHDARVALTVTGCAATTTRSLRLGRLSRKAKRAAARTGRLKLPVTVTGGGTVRVKATARLGRRTRTVATTTKTVTAMKATQATVTLKLSKAARKQLKAKRRLRVKVTVRAPGAPTKKLTLTLSR